MVKSEGQKWVSEFAECFWVFGKMAKGRKGLLEKA